MDKKITDSIIYIGVDDKDIDLFVFFDILA